MLLFHIKKKDNCTDLVGEDKKMNWALPSPDSYSPTLGNHLGLCKGKAGEL